ncbi:hypothetical protein Tco_0506240 [Tanacetum coccineum]
MGIFRETLAKGTEGALGNKHPTSPKDIYSLINHYTDAKDIWDNVKMLLEGSELTNEDRKSQLYYDFKHFHPHKGEIIHDYYIRFAKLINDMRNIKMTMSRMLLNSNFVNNMLPEWGRFITVVKLTRLDGLQLDTTVCYLKQYEVTAHENKMLLDRFTQHTVDPLALMSNVAPQQYNSQSSINPSSTYVPPHFADNSQLDSGLYPTDNLIENLTNTLGVQLVMGELKTESGMLIHVKQGRLSGHDNAIDEDVDEQPFRIIHKVDNVFQTDDCDAFDSDVDEAPMAQAMFMANLSYADPVYDKTSPSYDSDILSEEENLKKELHSVKLQLASTINHNKSMVEEVTSLKKDFKQKENKYLEEFLDMKALKEKVEDKLYKQDQSLQTVHMLCKPKPYYNEQNKVAIGYKNPLCLTRAKQVQPALYNGHEIIKNNHVPAIVHNTKDTLEIAEITRRKMNDKMKDPECVTHKVKIAPPDYSKENYLATFTPQKQLTPEQIFWSQDLIKIKAEALKEQTTASRPIKALTVYPPNIPATLVPRVLSTKSQVIINIFALIQLFLEFDKTCKKRITPTELTEGERGFEQTKKYYLTEVIPFFKTLKEHFEGIQKALTKEIKEMKDVFEELEAELDQNVVDRKHDEIERKNLLIANDNLIVDCLSKEVFYVATNSKLNLSVLRDKILKDNHNKLVQRFSNLEVNHLNLQLKYQNFKERFGNNPPQPARDTLDFDSVFVIGKLKASLQGKDNVIQKLKTQISHLQETRSEADRTLDFKALDFQITQLTEKVIILQEQNELFRAENAKIKQHYKELYDSIKITRAKHIEQTTTLTTENENLKAQIQNKMESVTKDHVKPTVLAPGKYAINVEPIPHRNRNNKEVHLDYLRHLKESVETLHEIVKEAKIERPLDRSIISAFRYTKHSQELLEYTIGTCPKDFNQRDKKHAPTLLIRKKQVTFEEQCNTSNSTTHKHVEQLNTDKTNALVPPSTGVNGCTDASGSQPEAIPRKIRSRQLKVSTR